MGLSKLFEHLVPADDEDLNNHDGDEQGLLLSTVCRILGIKAEDVSVDMPLTNYGLDSLSAAALSFALRPLLSISQLQLLADLSLKDLQERMEQGVSDVGSSAVADTSDEPDSNKVQEMEDMLARLSTDFTPLPPFQRSHRDGLGAVVVTGTTGSLGAHVLAHLLKTCQFSKVYALVRPGKEGETSMDRQIAAFRSRGLDAALLSSPILAVLPSSVELPSLGLTHESYEEVSQCYSFLGLLR